jgi:hypothetical protein
VIIEEVWGTNLLTHVAGWEVEEFYRVFLLQKSGSVPKF